MIEVLELPQSRKGSVPRTRLPIIGRETDRAAVVDLIVREARPLVTLTGPGGVGKTRLAIAVGGSVEAEFGERIWFVPAASISTSDLLIQEIAAVVGALEAIDRDLIESIAAAIGLQRGLLILDNLEHLLVVGPVLARLIERSSPLSMIVTSREPLSLRGEVEFSVRPLKIGSGNGGGPGSAERLFAAQVARTGAVVDLDGTEGAAVREICRRLDGLPLAIELAASWSRMLSPADLVERLDRRLDTLDRGPRDLPGRHQTMRAAIAWSYALLTDPEQHFFRAVSTFNGDFGLEAVESLATESSGSNALDLTSSIVAKNLLQTIADPDGQTGPRYLMLETIRAYGREMATAAGEERRNRDQHADWYVTFISNSGTTLIGPGRPATLIAIDREIANIRAALAWSIERGNADRAVQIVDGLWRYWEPRGLLREARTWFEAVFSMADLPKNGIMASALYGAAVMPYRQGDYAEARRMAMTSLELAMEIDDQILVANAYNGLGIMAYDQGNLDESIDFHERSLRIRRPTGDPHVIEVSLTNIGLVQLQLGRLDEAERSYSEAHALVTEGQDTYGLGYALNGLGLVQHRRGNLEMAQAYFEDARKLRELDDSGALSATLVNLAAVERDLGELDRASGLYRQAIELRFERGERPGLSDALTGLAALTEIQGNPDAAAVLFGGVEALRARFGIRTPDLDQAGTVASRERAENRMGTGAWQGRILQGSKLSEGELVELAASLTSPQGGTDLGAAVETPEADLTRREIEVLTLVAEGLSDQEIADRLFVSRATASRHVANIFAKIGVKNRTAAANYAHRKGLL